MNSEVKDTFSRIIILLPKFSFHIERQKLLLLKLLLISLTMSVLLPDALNSFQHRAKKLSDGT